MSRTQHSGPAKAASYKTAIEDVILRQNLETLETLKTGKRGQVGSFKATIGFLLPPTACMALVTKIMVLIPSSMPVDQDQAAQFRAVPVNMSCWFLGVDLEQVKGEVSHLVMRLNSFAETNPWQSTSSSGKVGGTLLVRLYKGDWWYRPLTTCDPSGCQEACNGEFVGV